jgi:hypothetical protein
MLRLSDESLKTCQKLLYPTILLDKALGYHFDLLVLG